MYNNDVAAYRRTAVLFGPPGCGKEKLGNVLVSSGMVHRVILKTYLLEHSDVMQSGGLVSDEIVVPIVDGLLSKFRAEKYLVLDGAGRSRGQMQELLRRVVPIVFIDLPVEECKRRIKKADDRGGRCDDAVHIVETRMAKYEEESLPALHFAMATRSELVHRIDGLKCPLGKAKDMVDRLGWREISFAETEAVPSRREHFQSVSRISRQQAVV